MALVPRVGELGEVLADGRVEGVVVGDVGREAADLLALSGESDDLGELLGAYISRLVSAQAISQCVEYLLGSRLSSQPSLSVAC